MPSIICIVIGEEKYFSETINLIKSIRNHGGKSSDTNVIIYTDKADYNFKLDNIQILPLPNKVMSSNRMTHRICKAMIYSNMPVEEGIFIDTDVECFGDFTELWQYCNVDCLSGVHDGRTPDPIEMMQKLTFKNNKWEIYAKQCFGDDYFYAHKPVAWNVGVLPMHRNIGKRIGQQILDMLYSIYNSNVREAYSYAFDEQIPLNYILWKLNIPTGTIPAKYNATKKIITNNKVAVKDVIFLHLRHRHGKNKNIYENFIKNRIK